MIQGTNMLSFDESQVKSLDLDVRTWTQGSISKQSVYSLGDPRKDSSVPN